MTGKTNNIKEISDLQHAAEKESEVEEKLDELINLLGQHDFDSETVKQFQIRFNEAISRKEVNSKAFDAFKVIDEKTGASRAELLDEFSTLLSLNKIDSKISRRYLQGERLVKVIQGMIGVVMITLGFGMIIMPAPPYFEMFTIFYFTRDDGVTLMDLISLIIILAGIYVLVRAIYKRNKMNNYAR